MKLNLYECVKFWYWGTEDNSVNADAMLLEVSFVH